MLSQNPISNIRVLDTYLTGASKFLQRPPLLNGITLVLPPAQHQGTRPHRHFEHHHHHHHPDHSHHGSRPHSHPLPLSAPPLHPLLLSQMERPHEPYEPLFHSVVVPKTSKKYRKSKKKFYSKYKPKDYYYSQQKYRSKYPKSINDRLRDKHYNNYEEEDEEDDDHNHLRHKHKDEHIHDDYNYDGHSHDEHHEDHRHFDDPFFASLGKPKSFYEGLPPYGKQKPQNPTYDTKPFLPINQTNSYRSQSYGKNSIKPESKYTERFRKPLSESESDPKPPIYKSGSLFESSPPYPTPNNLNFVKPIIQTNKPKSNAILSDGREGGREGGPQKFRTATANQLYLKQENKVSEKEQKLSPVSNRLPEEDLSSNDDPNHYPHQYAIEIRWKNKDSDHYHLEGDEEDGVDDGDREMHSSKDLDHARHRKYKHEEEEHWHEKKWLDEGLRQAYLQGKPIPVRIIKPGLKLEGTPDFSPMPLYAQPMPTGATLDQINQHFAIPTPNFRVNPRFMDWAKTAINLNNLQNNYIAALLG